MRGSSQFQYHDTVLKTGYNAVNANQEYDETAVIMDGVFGYNAADAN
ncbi:MAG: hypothetical protein NC409_13845 [Clostridium sp.]|nr:hypothetical protein [Clostridium sp.]